MKIAILHHLHTDLSQGRYLIGRLAKLWQTQGHEVMPFKEITPKLLSADAIVLHVDLTQLPEHYVHDLAAHPLVINRHITDISKTQFSDIQVKADDNYDGRVIIKTLCNFGGLPERQVRALNGSTELPVDTPINWATAQWLNHYLIAPSLKQVPAAVWQNPHLMVEKFLPEQNAEGHYQLREWIFFGDSDVHYMNVSLEPIIKSSTTIARVMLPLAEIPEKLRLIRDRLHIDYGKFDYAIHNGEVILYDINKTIGAPGSTLSDPEIQKAVLHLSEGLYHFIKDKCHD